MPTRNRLPRCGVLLAAAFLLLHTGFAKMEQWTDAQGKSFKAEPAELLGPFALFKLPDRTGKLLPLGQLNPKEYVRFAQQVQNLPTSASDWTTTKTKIGSDLYDRVLRLKGERLEPCELKGLPEPRFYALFFVNNGEGKSWHMLGKTGWQFQELQKKFPGVVEGVMVGVKHNNADHTKMAVQMKVPYLVASLEDEMNMSTVSMLVPSSGYGVALVNANGVVVFFNPADSDESAKALMDEISNFLSLIRPDNPRGWNDSALYWRTVQPALHAADKCGPLLVGDPLNAAKLREFGAKFFDATIYVSAEGKVTGVKLAAGAACPADLLQPISEALHKALFVAAVDQGKFVAGIYSYHFGERN